MIKEKCNIQDSISILIDKISEIKSSYIRNHKSNYPISEVLPLNLIGMCLEEDITEKLVSFVENNEIYSNSYRKEISGIECLVCEGDINHFWLNAKKYDTNYQPFMPTWLISAYVLAIIAQFEDYKEVIDIGSGDGRIAYIAEKLKLKSYSIEIDESLCKLQSHIKEKTRGSFTIINMDATEMELDSLMLKKPIFFISALPQWGDILGRSIVSNALSNKSIKTSGFTFIGGKSLNEKYGDEGWNYTIKDFRLNLKSKIKLPTTWTNDIEDNTEYIFTTFNK